MNRPLTLIERAIVRLNHIALTMHYKEFQGRINKLVLRLTGGRL